MDNYYEENNKRNIVLIIIIAIILIFIGLLSYKVFVLDKKNENKENKVVNENKLKLDSEIVQKYYNYISSDGSTKDIPYTINENLDYILNNKNMFAYSKIIGIKNLNTKACSAYINHINSISNDKSYVCFNPIVGIEGCDSSTNNNPSTQVYVISSDEIRAAVNILFGDESYVAGSFSLGGGVIFSYNAETDEYILLNTCAEPSTTKIYEAKVYDAEKENNNLYIYENVKYDGKELMNIKHIFEKNVDSDDYHYVKSEKA